MATEIERKFRIYDVKNLQLPPGDDVDQGYLANDPVVVRVRTKGPKAFLTLKYASEKQQAPGGAICRNEFEYQIPVEDARQLLNQCPHRLQKTRHYLPGGIELDVFKGRHEGLILAEYESEDGGYPEPVAGIEWKEVTDDPRYSNLWMAQNGVPDE